MGLVYAWRWGFYFIGSQRTAWAASIETYDYRYRSILNDLCHAKFMSLGLLGDSRYITNRGILIFRSNCSASEGAI